MKMRMWLTNNLAKIVSFILLAAFSIIAMSPIIWGVFGSFRTWRDLTNNSASFFPTSWSAFTFDGYLELFSRSVFNPSHANEYFPIWRWALNSLFVAVASTGLYLIIASLAAYAFVFLDFKWSNRIFMVLIATMTIPGVISTTPQLINMNNLGVYKSLWGLIIPGLGGVFGLFLIRQFFLGIPKDLVENARMDGASDFSIFRKVVVPLGKSALFVQGLFGFLGAWNDVAWAQLIVGSASRDTWTLSYGLKVMSDNAEAMESMTLALAGAVIGIVPIFIVYLIAQSYIIEGVAFTGMKR
ncbi:MAG: carbohydrate ABC transporter permease [Bacilli bacterium]